MWKGLFTTPWECSQQMRKPINIQLHTVPKITSQGNPGPEEKLQFQAAWGGGYPPTLPKAWARLGSLEEAASGAGMMFEQ